MGAIISKVPAPEQFYDQVEVPKANLTTMSGFGLGVYIICAVAFILSIFYYKDQTVDLSKTETTVSLNGYEDWNCVILTPLTRVLPSGLDTDPSGLGGGVCTVSSSGTSSYEDLYFEKYSDCGINATSAWTYTVTNVTTGINEKLQINVKYPSTNGELVLKTFEALDMAGFGGCDVASIASGIIQAYAGRNLCRYWVAKPPYQCKIEYSEKLFKLPDTLALSFSSANLAFTVMVAVFSLILDKCFADHPDRHIAEDSKTGHLSKLPQGRSSQGVTGSDAAL
eukprot:jgi/Bigna1/137629/aug1.40_g12337